MIKDNNGVFRFLDITKRMNWLSQRNFTKLLSMFVLLHYSVGNTWMEG